MKIRGRKVVAFILMNIIYLAIYFFTLFFAPKILEAIGNIIIIMLFGNAITFIGGNSLDKWIKSKYFNKDLFNDREN